MNKEIVITGVLSVHFRGFGFVTPDDTAEFSQDIFIPRSRMKDAVDGDHIEVMINPSEFSDKGPEGTIISVIKRGRSHLVGIVIQVARTGKADIYVPLLGDNKAVEVSVSADRKFIVGDRLSMKVTNWSDPILCEMTRYIGHISDASCDIDAALEEYSLRTDFPEKVLREAKIFGTKVTNIINREDFRDLETITIDPNTAKDFDDALTLDVDKKGNFHLGVHIADVSYYVRPTTSLDEEARLRCNSTYFPGRCVPMLPEELSNGLCSLKPNVNRLTVSVMMIFSPEGDLLKYDVVKGVIKSDKRFTYNEAKQALDGKIRSKHGPLLHRMVELCGILKRQRYNRGSIEFALPNVSILVDENGEPTGVECEEYDITHQLVEEFMLKANEVIATYLSDHGRDLTYRIHNPPTDFNDFVLAARAFGFSIKRNPSIEEIQELFDMARGSPHEHHLAVKFIKSMQLAYYSTENVGHYGLALENYCHFTSPIRRYIDLVVHRLIFNDKYDIRELDHVAELCSEHERNSARAENSVKQLKKIRYLDKLHNEDKSCIYEAVVTSVRGFGIYFEVKTLLIEGFIHISELPKDYFIFHEDYMVLEGKKTGLTYRHGTNIKVSLESIDFLAMKSSWRIISGKRSRKNRNR